MFNISPNIRNNFVFYPKKFIQWYKLSNFGCTVSVCTHANILNMKDEDITSTTIFLFLLSFFTLNFIINVISGWFMIHLEN